MLATAAAKTSMKPTVMITQAFFTRRVALSTRAGKAHRFFEEANAPLGKLALRN
jgi:hypothetical protein